MQVRYRVLSTDVEAMAAIAAVSGGADAGKSLLRAATEPTEIQSKEGVADVDELRKMLQSGAVKPTDIVDVGAGWQTFDECFLFDDQVEPLRLERKRQRKVKLMLLVAGSVAGAFVLFAVSSLVRMLI